ncbi:MAG: aspartate-semialdehyde dehydrogenase [Nannocystaceae bacterium]|jgi:aspartate-semialdehyde dehydrogenase
MRICILGATGLVGRETIDLVARAWPGAQLELYASRDQTLEHGGRSYAVTGAPALERDDAPGGDLAMVALDDDHSARYVPRLLALGYRVIDKSNTYRTDPAVPLCTAGVNGRRVGTDTRLVANPNCTTIPFALAMAPLQQRWGLTAATVSTYQAVSGAGIGPLDEFLADARRGYAEADRIGRPFDPGKYAGNTVPHNGKTDDGGFSAEERKLMFESRKILELPELSISAQCCRVAVAVGHSMNVWFTLGERASLAELEQVLGEAPRAQLLRLFPGSAGDGLSALACVADRDRALVGRLRVDPRDPSGRSFCAMIAGDNLRLGAATNAVRVASRWFASEDPALQDPAGPATA